MKVYLATDHTGFALKNVVKSFLQKEGYEVEDCGAYDLDKHDDYPDFVSKAAAGVSRDPEKTFGVILGGSGQGEQMLANKYRRVRCALFYAPVVPREAVDIRGKQSTDPFEIVALTRQHNYANMLSLATRFLTEDDALRAVTIFLKTPISLEERHVRRVEKIKKIEAL